MFCSTNRPDHRICSIHGHGASFVARCSCSDICRHEDQFVAWYLHHNPRPVPAGERRLAKAMMR